MKRRRGTIREALLLLLTGMLINIVVATSISQLSLPRWLQLLTSPQTEQEGQLRWPMPVPEHWPASPSGATHQTITGYRYVSCTTMSWWDSDGFYTVFRVVRVQTGWPAPALERLEAFEHREHTAAYPSWPWPEPVTGWFRGGIPVASYRFPIRPIFPGFALNTLLYTALAATLWYTPGFIRRARRRRRNACQSCGYPRAGLPRSASCPECGGGSEG
jgi:hypothetical protein